MIDAQESAPTGTVETPASETSPIATEGESASRIRRDLSNTNGLSHRLLSYGEDLSSERSPESKPAPMIFAAVASPLVLSRQASVTEDARTLPEVVDALWNSYSPDDQARLVAQCSQDPTRAQAQISKDIAKLSVRSRWKEIPR